MTVHLLDLTSEGSQLRADLVREAKERKARMLVGAIAEEKETRRNKVLAEELVRFAAEEENKKRVKRQQKEARQLFELAVEKRLKELQEAVRKATEELNEYEGRVSRGIVPTPHIREIVQAVAQYYGVSSLDILSARRAAFTILPRHVAMYIARTTTFLSHPQIGARMGRDHTTILHAVNKIARMMETDEELRATVEHLVNVITPPPVAMAAE